MEKIVVCISNPYYAEKLIQRGKVLADAFKGECVVLNVLKAPFDELDFNQLQTKLMFEGLADKYHVQLISEPSKFKKISYHIAQFAEEQKATQIVIGQVTLSKLELMLQDSLINNLFEKLEGVDLHIVEVSREVKDSEEYDRGIPAELIKVADGFEISLKSDYENEGKKGIFYKMRASDFSNGFFVMKNGKEHQVIKVMHGKVKKEDIDQINS
ncbi:histidine kinase [Neobacillus sp. DY30]|uniref:histidine kinase n=1 Tax=Neobacillus sp. DY30 TaxID=3047871 RepID=UPI0024C05B58|nr:histidine kinase [Neobacillus sp. DY30]WHX97987.1 histidine kinase [Neobacillus sp. DY30]